MINSPCIKVFVNKKHLTNGKQTGFEEAYLMGLDCRMSSFIRFTVYLSSGAIYSGLPIEAIYCDRFGKIKESKLETDELQPYSCLDGQVSVVEYELLKGAVARWGKRECNYLFTINYQGAGLSNDPEQYKTHNIMVLKNSGQLCALPNNKLRFKDNWFANSEQEVRYERTTKHYFAGG